MNRIHDLLNWRLAARIEIALLAVWVALAGAVWAFLAIGDEMAEGELTTFDHWMLGALRQPGNPHAAVGPHWLLESMRDITALGGYTVLTLVTIISVIALLAHRNRIQALVLAVFVPLAQLSTELLKGYYERPRPDFAVFGDLPASMSFPSGHSTVATATYFLLAVIVASLEAKPAIRALSFTVAAFLTVMVGFSRAFLGVHWPSDVVAGWCLGAAWALLAAMVIRAAAKARTAAA